MEERGSGRHKSATFCLRREQANWWRDAIARDQIGDVIAEIGLFPLSGKLKRIPLNPHDMPFEEREPDEQQMEETIATEECLEKRKAFEYSRAKELSAGGKLTPVMQRYLRGKIAQ